MRLRNRWTALLLASAVQATACSVLNSDEFVGERSTDGGAPSGEAVARGDEVTPSSLDGGDEAVTPAPGAFFVGSASATTGVAVATSISFSPPATARPGDLLVAFWYARVPYPCCIVTPSTAGWETVDGTPSIDDGFNQVWIGVRTLATSDTTFSFTATPTAGQHDVIVAAFRGARAVEPVDPHVLEVVEADAGSVVETSPLTARARSMEVIVVGTQDVTLSWPSAPPGLSAVQLYPHLAVYHADALVGEADQGAAFHLPSGGHGIAVGTLAVVVGG